MQRREFLTASAAAALGLAASKVTLAADRELDRHLIELRVYHFASADKLRAYEQFLAQSAIPALNRAGIEPVGAFKLLAKDNAALKLTADSTDLYLILPHKSPESVLLETRLAADEAFQKSGQAILNAPKSDPAFVRYESTLMIAFEGFPQLQAPSKSEQRVAQLRTYESHSSERALKKIEMFNKGEIEVFKRCGMNPVFFGQSLAGPKLPNLTYMLEFDDQAAMDKAWKAFRDDPDWKKLSKDEAYKDTVSNITNLILRPIAGSQI